MFYPHEVVLLAAGITAGLVICITIFAFQVTPTHISPSSTDSSPAQTKIDFTMCGGMLVCVLFVFMVFGFLLGFGGMLGLDIELLHLVYSAIGVLIFSVYLVYDTQVKGARLSWSLLSCIMLMFW